MDAPPTRDATAAPQRRSGAYKRAYKACEACRRAKGRCELQPEFSGGPCVRCSREQRQCVFPVERSAKRIKTANPSSRHHAASGADTAESVGRAASKSAALPTMHSSGEDDSSLGVPPQPDMAGSHTHGSHQAHEQRSCTRSPLQDHATDHGDLSEHLAKTMVTSSKDAIGLLFRAATQNDIDSRSDNDGQVCFTSNPREALSDADSPSLHSTAQLPPQLSQETLALWNKHRFVVQGWFSASEAISYLQFFVTRLAPLSPVADFFHADHDTHKRLILDEPLLCCTVLMIASRYLAAHGQAGKTRSSFIHTRLWRHIEHLVQRITFGAEKYSSAKSRTLGSILALLLIIEWHPRLLHFPPEHDGWDAGLVPAVDDAFQPQDRSSEAARRWREDVFEPAKRSDRLSWSLVGLAITLAHELGVFDPPSEDSAVNAEESATSTKKLRIKRLLYLYSQQLSLRLGCPNMFPQGDHSFLQFTTSATSVDLSQTIKDRENLLWKWIEITKLLTTATHMFFSSKTAIRKILRTNQYITLLEHFQPLLTRWHEDFSRTSMTTVPEASKQALLVEYYYTRMYISSIALQAFVERASQSGSGDSWLEQDFLRKERAQDLAFIDDVRVSSGQILVISKKLSDEGILLYLPVRFFLRIVAASIFLLKTVCLGLKGSDAKVALDQLEDAVQALMCKDSDDLHLSSSYAELIARHVRKMKRRLDAKRAGRDPAVKPVAQFPTASTSRVDTERENAQSLADSNISHDLGLARNGTNDANDMNFESASISAGSLDDPYWDDWLTRPLDPLVAPFGIEPTPLTAGFSSDSLDFLWGAHA